MKQSLNGEYFNWLCDKIARPLEDRGHQYRQLFNALYMTPFYYGLWQDGNREAYGIELRYCFGRDKNIAESAIAGILDVTPCSVLEIMVALSLQMEEVIADRRFGDRTGIWFSEMIRSLGLLSYFDGNFDEEAVLYILHLFMHRHYQPNGAGGLFTIKNATRDMREIELWAQAMWWLDENLKEETHL